MSWQNHAVKLLIAKSASLAKQAAGVCYNDSAGVVHLRGYTPELYNHQSTVSYCRAFSVRPILHIVNGNLSVF